MIDINTILQNLGLEEKEVKIYLALLELGRGTVQEVAQKSGVKRTNIYNFIGPLKTKRIVSEIIDKDRVILIPESPDVLVRRAEDNLNNIKNVLPEILSIYNTPASKPKVHFYEGIDGMKRAYEDILDTGETVYGFSDYEKMFEAIEHEWLLNFPYRRKDKKIFFYSITKDGPKGKNFKRMDKEHFRETKLTNNLQLDTEINIYGNKVSIHSFRRPYSAVIIENRAIAMSMKSIWQGWWNTLKK